MGEARIPKKAGFVSVSQLPRGPNGLACCRQCGEETPNKRRTFCSDSCVHDWRLTTDPNYQRRHVEKRDACVCALCGVDTKVQREELLERFREKLRELDAWPSGASLVLTYGKPMITWVEKTPEHTVPRRHHSVVPNDASEWFRAELKALSIPLPRLIRGPVWDMDHIVPVVEGGGGCGLDNLRTLCRPCHKRVTADLRKRMATKKAVGDG